MKKAFTLVELLVCIVVVIFLVRFVVGVYHQVDHRAEVKKQTQSQSIGNVVHSAEATYQIEKPKNYFNDYINLTSPTFGKEMNDFLIQFEKESSCQIICTVFGPLENYTKSSIEDFAQDLFNRWKPGVKGKDNGALLLLFVDKNTGHGKARIHVGYGLEGKLTDGQTKLLQERHMVPHFKNKKWETGIKNGLIGIIQLAKGEYTGNGLIAAEGQKSFNLLFFFIAVVVIAIVLLILVGNNHEGTSAIFYVLSSLLDSNSSRSSSSSYSSGGGSSGGGGSNSSW